jgi:flagellar assembly protein FliH
MPAIIKQNDRLRRIFGTKAPNLHDVEILAGRVLDKARNEASKILLRAQEEAETLRRRAFETGKRDGHAEGYERGTTAGHEEALRAATEKFNGEQEHLVDAIGNALSEFEQQRTELLSSARDDVLRLALKIARRVTKRSAAGDPQAATENLREVLERIGKRHVVRITVNPEDAESMRRFAEEFATASQQFAHTVITEDADMARGGCRLQLPEGEIDASIDAQLDRIAEALLPGEPQA